MNKLFINAIDPLKKLMEGFGMDLSDWCISGECAWAINGYDVLLRDDHIDIYVKSSKLPWKVRDMIQTVPPMESKELNEYSDFMERTSISLHMIPLPKPKVTEEIIETFGEIKLISGMKIQVISPAGNMYDLEATLSSWKLEDFGEDRLGRWKHYLKTVYDSAKTKKDTEISEKAKVLLKTYFDTVVD